jgi:putative hydrolase of the HAD superfamily
MTSGNTLPAPTTGLDADLARRYLPVIRLDADEPYVPLVMGFTLFRSVAQSASCKFEIAPKADAVIEYAIWYDWDIQHLYDLEHVWVHIDAAGAVVAVEASFHGLKVPMDLVGGLPKLEGDRPVLYAEPGKHAHWVDGHAMALHAGDKITRMCGADAGKESVHRGNPFFADGRYGTTPFADRLARLKMKRDAFVPRFAFDRSSDDADVVLTDWPTLAAWIPQRVDHLVAHLPVQVPHLGAVFLDCGDTLIDESTEQKVKGTEIVTAADEIPHAMEAVRELAAKGYALTLVADGPRATFENLLKPRGIWDLMQAHVISGDIGELKPSPKMFAAAMKASGLTDEDRGRVVMVGNNLSRDIKGANDFGLQSLFVGWSKRRTHAAADPSEVPDARIDRLDHLVPMIEAMELALDTGGGGQ